MKIFAVLLSAALFFCGADFGLLAEELQADPSLKEYTVTVSDGIITQGRNYYHVTVIHPGQEYLIACQNQVLATENIYWKTETRVGGSGNSISIKHGSYSLRCADSGLVLDASSGREGGSWTYENSHLVFTLRSREGSQKYYLTYALGTESSIESADEETLEETAETKPDSAETPEETSSASEETQPQSKEEEKGEEADSSQTKDDSQSGDDNARTQPQNETKETAGEPARHDGTADGLEKETGATGETSAAFIPHGLARLKPAGEPYVRTAREEPLNQEMAEETCRFGCSKNETDAAVISLYTYGELNPCDVRLSADFDYHILGEEVSVALPALTYRNGLEGERVVWNIAGDSADYSSPEDVRDALKSIAAPGVYPVTATVSGKTDGLYYLETSSPQNYIVASGILDNSVLTFSDVHMEFEAIGKAIRDIMHVSGGMIPSLAVCTGDWANGHGITYEYTKDTILPLIDAQLCGIDTVYVAGNHESGKAASEASIRSDIGAGSEFMKGYGVIFDSSSQAAAANARSSRHASDLAVYGINYDAMYDSEGHPSYTNIIADVKTFLETAARRNPKTMALLSAHAGMHVIGDWAGGANYNIEDSYLLVEAINEIASAYNLDVMFLFGHDHSRNEKEFILQRGETITSPVYYRGSDEKMAKDEILCFSYAHAGYLTSSIGGNQHYSLITWDENSITHHLEQIGVGVDTDTVIERLSKEPQYIVVSGQESSWTKGGGQSAPFEIQRTGYDLAFELFESAQVDGNALTEENYEASRGSLVLALKSTYLETLAAGKHTLHVAFSDSRSADITFYVKDGVPSPSVSPTASPSASPAPSASLMRAVPNTADPFQSSLWAGLLASCITAAALSIWLLKQYR